MLHWQDLMAAEQTGDPDKIRLLCNADVQMLNLGCQFYLLFRNHIHAAPIFSLFGQFCKLGCSYKEAWKEHG